MLSTCIFSLHFSYHAWGRIYCQIILNVFYCWCITDIAHSTPSLSNISKRFISSPIFLIVGVFLIYRNFSYIEDISLLLQIFNLQNLSLFMFDGCNNLLEFSDINCTYFKFFFCLFYYSGMRADLRISLYTCLMCLPKPTSVIMGER